MNKDNFDKFIDFINRCPDELVTARKRFYANELARSTVLEIIFHCKHHLEGTELISPEAREFFQRVYTDAVQTHFTLDNERKILSLKVKELEEQSS